MTISPRQIALIHVAKYQVGMTDADYRTLLAESGVSSSRDLTPKTLDRVMQEFKALGFVPRRKFKKPPESKKRLASKVEAVLADLSLPQAYADAMARHMFRVDCWRWLDADQLHRLVAALTYHQRRKGRA